jgi:nitroreductase
MDVYGAVRQRRSIRAFRPDPVPRKVMEEVMEAAVRAPSWANTQPWEFAIVTGPKLEEIKDTFAQKAMAGDATDPDLAVPRDFPEPFNARRRAVGRELFEIVGIGREDREGRGRWQLQGLRLFEAPVVVYILTERAFYSQEGGANVWPVFDCGLVAENIMLLATQNGLGTIPAIQAVMYPEVLRRVLGIADTKVIVLGIAVGYPDEDSKANHFHSPREPLESVTAWHGF